MENAIRFTPQSLLGNIEVVFARQYNKGFDIEYMILSIAIKNDSTEG